MRLHKSATWKVYEIDVNNNQVIDHKKDGIVGEA